MLDSSFASAKEKFAFHGINFPFCFQSKYSISICLYRECFFDINSWHVVDSMTTINVKETLSVYTDLKVPSLP